jgi:prolyl oligopeptidase PreP (S9A serine peptidase family)
MVALAYLDKVMVYRSRRFFVKRNIIVTILMALSLPITAVEQPSTPKSLVTDIYHGVKVSENYRWLENWDDPKVKEWSDAQNAYARDTLDIGGSNGGLLMGATFTQNPDLVSVAVSVVGIYDMLRVELSPNGAFNITEFGTVKNPDHFKALYAYSPYHNVRNNCEYPAILFLTGADDPRVDPMQSRKMTARLQEANRGDSPILLRTSAIAGHGAATPLDKRIELFVDIYAFLFNYLNVTF